MLNETQIGELWNVFADYVDKKQIEAVAERYVEFLADHGVSDRTFQHSLGLDPSLDQAISYYLEEDEQNQDDYDELDF